MSANSLKQTPVAESPASDTLLFTLYGGVRHDYPSSLDVGVSREVGVAGSTGAGTFSELPVEAATGVRATANWYRLHRNALAHEITPAKRLYPHLFDENESAGKAVALVSKARGDTAKALEAFGEADLEAVDTYLKLVAATMNHAHRLADFNKSFGALVGYIRRACLIVSSADCSRAGLNALAKALGYLEQNPTLTLMDAAKWSEQLRSEGWSGDMPVVERLFQTLVDDLDLTPEQKELFQTSGSHSPLAES